MMGVAFPSGTVVGSRFSIEAHISDGHATVYRATDLLTGDPVVLKILPTAASNYFEQARITREAQLLASLEHPAIVRYIGHGQTENGLIFLALEWLTGQDLGEFLRERSRLSVPELLRVLRQLCDALSVAHRRGIIHRDIKPANVFLRHGQLSRVTLLDFGIARSAGQSKFTSEGVIVGTPGYLSPEQARGTTTLLPSVDVFAVGCLAYACLVGRSPFFGRRLESVLLQTLFEAPTTIRQLRPDCPAALERLIEKMLEKDPAARLPDAMAVLAELDRIGFDPPTNVDLDPLLSGPPPPSALTSRELLLVTVLYAQLDPAETDDGAEKSPPDVLAWTARSAALRAELEQFGMSGEIISRRTFIGSLVARWTVVATDQAERAARCALRVLEHFSSAVVVLATGRGTLDGKLPTGEALDSALEMAKAQNTVQPGRPSGLIVMDRITADLVADRFSVAPTADGALVLIDEPTLCDLSRRLLGQPTPCIGRENELEMLDRLLTATIEEGTPRALIILGPPGAGKSRLRHEFVRRVALRKEPLMVRLATGDPLYAETPFSTLRNAALNFFGIQPKDSVAVQKEKLLRGQALQLDPLGDTVDREHALRYIGALCGLNMMGDDDAELERARQRAGGIEEEISNFFINWLRAESAAHPVLLLVEDLQWCDATSLQALNRALRTLEDSPFFVLGFGRIDAAAQLKGLWEGCAHTIPLRPLNRRACERLTTHALGSTLPAANLEQIVEQSAGNPLFLEELIRAFAEGKGDVIPDTVRAMLQARVGRLEPTVRLTLRAASIFGERCWLGGVAALLGMELEETNRWLQILTREELLQGRPESRFSAESEYRFRHSLMREAVYDLLRDEDRRLGHKLAAQYLATVDEGPDVLAYHHEQAGELEQALNHLLQSASIARQDGQVGRASALYQKATALLSQLPDTPKHKRILIDIMIALTPGELTSQDRDVLMARLDRAQALLFLLDKNEGEAQEDLRRQAYISLSRGRLLHYAGRIDEAIRLFQEMLPLATQLGSREFLHTPTWAIGRVTLLSGHFGRSLPFLSKLSDEPLGAADSSNLGFYAASLAATGRYLKAQEVLERGRLLVMQLKEPAKLGQYLLIGAMTHMLAGNWAAGLASTQSVLPIIEHTDVTSLRYGYYDLLAWAKARLGEYPESFLLHAQSQKLRESLQNGILWDWPEASEVELLLLAGSTAEALERARRLADWAEKNDRPFTQARALCVQASALSRLNADPAEVEAYFQAALELAHKNEQVVHAAQIEVAWGQILKERGQADAAKPHLERGLLAFEEAGCQAAAIEARQLIRV